MEPLCRRLYLPQLVVLLILLLAGNVALADTPTDYNEEVIIARIKSLKNSVVAPRYDAIVKSYIQTYTERRRDAAQRIVGRSVMYFPVFEEYLRRHNLPEDLKYLAIVESALDPRAVSSAGAVGLWQFMPSTGRWIGMEINSLVDERCDPLRATEAAAVYLGQLFDRFGDWELAIAAYNSGGGRVSRAMKRARSNDFWQIRRFLPRETSNYVPAFIAAHYLMSYYEEHDLVPEYPDLDLQLTKTIQVYNNVSFYEIAQITELPLDVIEALNPSYFKSQIPESAGGRNLTLPLRVMGAMEEYLRSNRPDPGNELPLVSKPVFVSRPTGVNSDYTRSTYVVRTDDRLDNLAKEFNCSVHQIRAWNKLASDELMPGQKLIIFHPKEFKRFQAMEKMEDVIPIAARLPVEVPTNSAIWVREQKRFITKGGYLFYHAPKAERVFELAQRLPDISIRDLMQLNGFKGPMQLIKTDSFVRIRKM